MPAGCLVYTAVRPHAHEMLCSVGAQAICMTVHRHAISRVPILQAFTTRSSPHCSSLLQACLLVNVMQAWHLYCLVTHLSHGRQTTIHTMHSMCSQSPCSLQATSQQSASSISLLTRPNGMHDLTALSSQTLLQSTPHVWGLNLELSVCGGWLAEGGASGHVCAQRHHPAGACQRLQPAAVRGCDCGPSSGAGSFPAPALAPHWPLLLPCTPLLAPQMSF